VRARKRFGQHFLEPAWVAKLVSAIAPHPTDQFLEIGPGRGAITAPLADKAGRLLAIEVDRDLVLSLQQRNLPNVAVVAADVLDCDLAELAARLLDARPDRKVRIVGNLPYNISSPILIRLLEAAAQSDVFQDATLMLQKEVADRLHARPGTREYGVLTLTAALGADVTELLALPPGAFRPAPKVRSAVVRLAFRPAPSEVEDRQLVVAVARAIFQQRRKVLSNALSALANAHQQDAAAVIEKAGLDPRQRPETLTVVDVARIASSLGR
jgi:16S rRNA (adenine1518-N6/adenine1519-N6)-dimethyltransferase